MLKKLVTICLFLTLTTNYANAKKLENLFDDWYVLSAEQDKQKICYIASIPKNEEGNYKERKEPYLLVSLFNDRSPEVSLSSGYEYKIGSSVKANIGNKQYEFRNTHKNIAWLENENLDKEVVAAMKAGNKVTIKSSAENGTYSVDTYSLIGFSKAYEKMFELCQAQQRDS